METVGRVEGIAVKACGHEDTDLAKSHDSTSDDLHLTASLSTHRPLSSSFLGLPYRILNINHEKELLRGLWLGPLGFGASGFWALGLIGCIGLRVSTPERFSA